MRAERLLDYQRNSQKIRPWDDGGEKGGKKENRRYRERESTQTQSRGFILHRQRNTNRKRIFSSPGPERDKKSNLYSIPSQRRLPCSSACIFVNTASSEQLNLPCANAGWRWRRGDGMRRLGRRGHARLVQAKPHFLLSYWRYASLYTYQSSKH